MAKKIYTRTGNRTPEEKKYIRGLQKFMSENPDTEIKPVNNLSQLKKLYTTHCTEEIEFTETASSEADDKKLDDILNESSANNEDGGEYVPEDTNEEQTLLDHEKAIDPFNEKSAIIRDHVINDQKFDDDPTRGNSGSRTSFAEPTSFKESFEIPNKDGDKQPGASTSQGAQQSGFKKEGKQESFNPAANDLSQANRKKSNKRFAKYIVEFTCFAAEKGFIWWSSTNIDRNIRILRKEGFDTSMIITINEETQVTIAEFFELQQTSAEQLSKISQDDKDELVDALAAWLLEKGFSPTPTQEFLVIVLSIFGKQGLILTAHTMQTNAVVASLRRSREGTETQDAEVVSPQSVKENVNKTEAPVQQPSPQQAPVETEKAQQTVKAKSKKKKEGDYLALTEGKKQVGDETKE